MSDKIDALVKEICDLSLADAASLAEELKSKLNIPDMAMAMPAAGGDASGGGAAKEAEQTEFTVVLDDASGGKIPIIKVIKEELQLSLGDAKKMVDSAPVNIKEGLSKDEAEELKKKLEEAKAKVSIK